MAIGVFDSGVGGLTVHRALTDRFPRAAFIYFADQANAPIGGLPGEAVVELTRRGCERLFDAGATLVILACNTASAVALRSLQEGWLPDYRRRTGRVVNVLGIIVPTIETVTGRIWAREPGLTGDGVFRPEIFGVFCTPATASSHVYEIEIAKRRPNIATYVEPCPDLAGLIERGAPEAELRAVVRAHVEALRRRIGRHPDKALMGCTHYEIIAPLFAEALPPGVTLVHQPSATAEALARYLARHKEYGIGETGARRFLTTGAAGAPPGLVGAFWGGPLAFERV